MPLLSTLGSASIQSYGAYSSNKKTASASLIDSGISFGQFSASSSADINSGDILFVAQASADDNVTTYPNPVSDGYYSPTGFTRGNVTWTNYGTSSDSTKRFATAGVSYRYADGTEPGTTMSGFLPQSADGYAYSHGLLLRLRPNFTANTVYSKDDSNAYNSGGTGTITPTVSIGTVPLTRCTVLISMLLSHNSSNSSNFTFTTSLDSMTPYRVAQWSGGVYSSSFMTSGLRRIDVHVFPNGTNVGDITASYTSDHAGYATLHLSAYELGE